ncbi:MAG: hypothetical protein D6805_05500 [Planctomycetota bacterium]|nr:MAG: hypothetical protein D6805_05500 [Planctomycetota bacterium]
MRKNFQKKAIALLLSLFLLVLLTVVVVEFADTTTIHQQGVKNFQRLLETNSALKSAYVLAKKILLQDLENSATDSLNETWANLALQTNLTISSTSLSLQIEDEERYIPLNLLADPAWRNPVAKQLTRLLKTLGHPPQLAEAIADYIDIDKEGKYENNAKNAPLDSLEELLTIEDIDQNLLYGNDQQDPPQKGLARFLTLHSQGPVNINTAPYEVLLALHDSITPDAVDEILQKRKSKPFEKIEELSQISGLENVFTSEKDDKNTTNSNPPSKEENKEKKFSEQISVSSYHFRLRLSAKNATLQKSVEVLIKREKENWELIYWRQIP